VRPKPRSLTRFAWLSIAAAIVTMGKAMRLRVVAEGVETAAQRDLLAGWGCDEMQGFLFSRALPADAVTRFLPPRRAGAGEVD